MSLLLNYLSFVVADLERSLAFYRTLGLPIPEGAHLNRDGDPEDHVEITSNGLRIAWETEALIRQVVPGWSASAGHPRLGVAFQASAPAEVDAACQRLRTAGYTVRAEPYDAFWGQRYASVSDPDGQPIDLYAWLAEGDPPA